MTHHPPRSRRSAVRRRRIVLLGVAAVGVAITVVLLLPSSSGGTRAGSRAAQSAPLNAAVLPGTGLPTTGLPANGPAATTPTPAAGTSCPCPYLAPGSDPAALPGPVLIADHQNNRLVTVQPNGTISWIFPRPEDLAPGQTFLVPDDAFMTPDGQDVVVTQEDDFVISLVDVAQHRIVWRYGTPGVPGSGPNKLWNPDDAMMQPNGDIISADIKNCRIVILSRASQLPIRVYGTTTDACWHDPPLHWGSPNGAFPMANGDYLITEINGDWVDELTLTGRVRFSVHPPGVSYPSDTNEVRPGVYLTSDFSSPGLVEEFDQQGRLLWRFPGAGGEVLNHPSLALPLPNGDVLCNDDYNHRVIVIDPRANRVVWQYGHTGKPGSAPGYLNDPDGVDLLPPLSLTISHAATMGNG